MYLRYTKLPHEEFKAYTSQKLESPLESFLVPDQNPIDQTRICWFSSGPWMCQLQGLNFLWREGLHQKTFVTASLQSPRSLTWASPLPCPPTPRQIQELHLPLQTDDVMGLCSCSCTGNALIPSDPTSWATGSGQNPTWWPKHKNKALQNWVSYQSQVGSKEEKWATLLSSPGSIISNNTFLQVFCNTLGLILAFDEPTQLSNPKKS